MENINLHQNFIIESLKLDLPNSSKFLNFKKRFCSQNKIPQPTNADLRELYEKMITKRKIKRNPQLEKVMLSRAIRTQSGVAVVAVLTKPSSCPGKCIFCPTEKDMPKSYLSNEPAVMRAIMNKFNPYRQVQGRLKALELNGHSTEKIELIVMGGTFSYFPRRYQQWFIKECFRACNDYPKKQKINIKKDADLLYHEQKRNELIKHRVVGLTLETRPDYIDDKEILNFRQLGCTRVEIGVQSIFDDILKLNNRGHLISETIRATKLLKNAGFKINYHMMPGLYGSSPAKDFKMFKELFSNSDFQPDMLKIYPTIVIKNSKLYKLWKNGEYKAMTDKQFEKLIIKIKNEVIPPYTRIQRLVRDVPLPSIEAGPKISNLRQLVAEKASCKCIRCREIKGEYNQVKQRGGRSSRRSEAKPSDGRGATSLLRYNTPTQKQITQKNNALSLNRINYPASDGKEIFLQFIDNKNRLYALLRLRINPKKLKNSNLKIYPAIIRELHTYGKLAPVGKQDVKSPQHIGFGKKLIKEAEKISREELTKLDIPKNQQSLAIISGIGVRAYYRKLGYRLQGTYMVKRI